MDFCRIFWEKRLDQFYSVKLDLAFKMTHFHVYIKYSNIELLPSFRRSQYLKNEAPFAFHPLSP